MTDRALCEGASNEQIYNAVSQVDGKGNLALLSRKLSRKLSRNWSLDSQIRFESNSRLFDQDRLSRARGNTFFLATGATSLCTWNFSILLS